MSVASRLYTIIRSLVLATPIAFSLGIAFVLSIYFFLPSVTALQAASISHTDIFTLTNNERTERRVGTLTYNDTLEAVARKKLIDLVVRGYFAHESPTGEHASDIAKEEGYNYLVIGENLAAGTFGSSQDLVKAWMNSPGHRENMLNKGYQEIGVAVAQVSFAPAPFNGRRVWVAVQEFGTQKSACGSVDQTVYDRILESIHTLTSLQATIEEKRPLLSGASSKQSASAIQSFNRLVESYNDAVRLLRKEVAGYNAQVEHYRTCVASFISS